jgi:uncharacterized repeat protein (TIGR02543 family)
MMKTTFTKLIPCRALVCAIAMMAASLAATTLRAQDIAIDATNFPDVNFRGYVMSLDDGDGVLSPVEISEITEINVSHSGIFDLKGIEFFTALTELNCGGNLLTALDVSANTLLVTLECFSNQLTVLDVSKNIALEFLDCTYSQLNALDVSGNNALQTLYCKTNHLTELDISYNSALKILDCQYNLLTSLDASKNTTLEELNCNNNELTALDVSKNIALEELNCYNNQLTALDVSKNTSLQSLYCDNNRLVSLDISENTATLKELYCSFNQLTSLDVSTNTALTKLLCEGNLLNTLDLSVNTALTSLFCGGNHLTALDVSTNTALTSLFCYDNHLNTLDLSGLNSLQSFQGISQTPFPLTLIGDGISFNAEITLNNPSELAVGLSYAGGTLTSTSEGITSSPFTVQTNKPGLTLSGSLTLNYPSSLPGILIDATNFPDVYFRNFLLSQPYGSDVVLTDTEISGITAIDVTDKNISNLKGIEFFTSLQELNCDNNLLTSLDVSTNTALQILSCNYNRLATLNVSGNTALQVLYCENNQLTTIDVSVNTSLQQLACSVNQLTELNVSVNTVLKFLGCAANPLTTLDISANTALQQLWCSFIQLTSLDISKNTALEKLDCAFNQLTSLDVSSNTALTELWCESNQLTALDLTNLNSLSYLFGFGQSPILTLMEADNSYGASIALNNPTGLATGLSYAEGMLTSTSYTVTSSPFTVETNKPGFTLSGTLQLSYAAATFTITFAGDGFAVFTQIVANGGKVTKPADPVRTGYTFGGWFTDNNTFADEWDFAGDVVTQNITLYAKWTAVAATTFTVTFAGDGVSIASQTVADGGKVTKPADPVRTGYTFGGWYTDNGTFLNGWDFTTTVVTQNITLYAKWTAVAVTTFTVTFAGENVNIVSQTVVQGGKIAKPADPVRAGYTFGGWFTDNGTFLKEWDFNNNVVIENIILYAKWESITGNDAIEASAIRIYPNPAENQLTIDNGQLKIEKIVIIDISGRVVLLPPSIESGGGIVDVSTLSAGVYFIRLETGKDAVTRKFIKK